MLTRLKLPLEKIKKAILEVDDDILTADELSTMSRMLPTSDEVCDPVTSI